MRRGFRNFGLILVLLAVTPPLPSHAQDDSEESAPRPRTAGETRETSASEDRSNAAVRREELRRTLAASPRLQLPGSIDPETYRVGPGDQLQLSISGGISRLITLEVGPEGTVLLPTSGTLDVNGLTLREARNRILARLKPDFRGVMLDVRLLRPRTFLVYVTGQVKNPGSYEATGTSRVGDLILQSEPLERASLRQIEVVHRDGTRDRADLELFLRTSSQSLNPWVRDGDVLHVPTAASFVHMLGAVSLPSIYELGPRDSLRTLIALGGGLLPSADSTRALIVRWQDASHAESLWVDVPRVLSGETNPVLRNGDRLYVYFVPLYQQQNDVIIVGQVRRPGAYPITVGRDRVSDAIRIAGGFLEGADLAAIRIRRVSGVNAADDAELQRLLRLSRSELTDSEYEVLNTKLASQREEYRIDWSRLQSEPSLDVLLLGGDVVQVERLVNSIRVDGQVRRPGILTYRPGVGVEDYVADAGGYSRRAWRAKIRVTRSVTGQTFLAKDLQKLDPGDLIWVPEKRDVTFWGQTSTLLMAAAQVATVVLAFRTIGR